jgi:hypothetical protein
MSKIQNIDHCWECKEHYDYGWNNLDRCGETGKLLSDIEVIPTWCPLPDKAGDDILTRLQTNQETFISGGPIPQHSATEPRYKLIITGPESLLKELVGEKPPLPETTK